MLFPPLGVVFSPHMVWNAFFLLADLLKQARRLILQAMLSTDGKTEALSMLGDLGEVLLASGSDRGAELVLRSALLHEQLPPDVRRLFSYLFLVLDETFGRTTRAGLHFDS